MTPEEIAQVETRLANSWYVGDTERFARAFLAERAISTKLAAQVENRDALAAVDAVSVPSPNPPSAVEEAAVLWWESHRPTSWSLRQHCEEPAVNTSSSLEAALAVAVSDFVAGSEGTTWGQGVTAQ